MKMNLSTLVEQLIILYLARLLEMRNMHVSDALMPDETGQCRNHVCSID
jgi:hypothetical protein